MASSPVTAPSTNTTSPSPPDSNSSNSTSSSSPPPFSSPPPPSSSPPPAPPTSPPPAPPTSPPPAPPTSPPPAPPTSSPPPTTTESPPPKESPPVSSPPPPAESESTSPPPKETTPSSSASPPPATPSASPPPNTPSASPPPPSSTPSPPAPPTASPTTPVTPPSSTTNTTTPSAIFSPPPPITAASSESPPSSSSAKLSPPPSSSEAPVHKSPPPPSKSSGSSSSSPPSDSSSSSNVAIIAGIAVAGVLIIAFIIVCVACARKKKKRKPYSGEYYTGAMPYNGTTPWNNTTPSDHIVKIPPPPGVMGTPLGGGGWAAPPAPPAANTSSDFSSGYSGPPHPTVQPPSPSMALGFSQSQFSYNELAAATGGFSQANLLGQGGFGYVHKGVLPNGQEVAVKSLKTGSGQGEREFQAEVEIISRVHHRHLVSLVGYCIADGQRMLVYEFVANKTMEFHLHGKGQPVMDWATRLRIALGSAKGLGYLHEDCHPKIIHRDIKAANILLDNKFEAMVADFGLAKLSSDTNTHVSTRVMGTFGYLAPEYASSGKLTEKSDVFSFGVMLLELITGRKPVDPTSKFMEDSLVDWARPLLTKALGDGNYDELVDPRLEDNFLPHEMARMVACASASIRHSARRRPKMSQIVRALDGDSSLDDLNEGVKPGQSSIYNSSGGSTQTQSYDTGAYNADMMKFRKMVMSSQDFTSSEYGATSEYGLNTSSTSSGDSREMGAHSGIHSQKF